MTTPQRPLRALYFEIFTVSFAAILLEITYTRIFSFKLYYYFTYLIIGIGLLGLGAGGVFVAISQRLRDRDPERLIPGLCTAGGASVLVGYVAIALIPLNVSELALSAGELTKLVVVCVMLIAPFLATGMIIATILGSRADRVSRLYGVDLLGAALGCALCIPLLEALDPPRCIVLAGLFMTLAGARLAFTSRLLAIPGAGVAFSLALALLVPGALPDPRADVGKYIARVREQDRISFSEWNPVFRVDVAGSEDDPVLVLLHDGSVGSGIHKFDGDLASLGRLRRDPRQLPFQVLDPAPRVLVIGAAGGHELLASLFFGAERVTGVELNPVTVRLLTERYADYAGHIHAHPKVELVNAEGRSFMKGRGARYDLVWFVAPDSYAAMNAASSAAFVLSESYLYTVEMIRESLAHLREGGVVCAQFGELSYKDKPNRTLRYLATARKALAREGIDDFGKHVLVASSKGLQGLSETTILLSKTPFRPDQVERFEKGVAEVTKGVARHLPEGPAGSGPVARVISLPGPELTKWLDAYPYLVDPVEDDAPFFWHFARFRDALRAPLRLKGSLIDYEDAIGEQVMVILLLVAGVFAAVFLLLPFVAIRGVGRKMQRRGAAGLYFACLGLGFMFFEVCLIQRLTLLLGYPTYSLSVTLFGLLVFSGLGSLASERFAASRDRALLVLWLALGGLVLVYLYLSPGLVNRFIGEPLAERVALTLALIAPLGLILGAFMPLGLVTVTALGEHDREYVAWAWAVNGFFSVLSSTLATVLAMTVGFGAVLVIALAIYGVAVVALARIPAPSGTG